MVVTPERGHSLLAGNHGSASFVAVVREAWGKEILLKGKPMHWGWLSAGLIFALCVLITITGMRPKGQRRPLIILSVLVAIIAAICVIVAAVTDLSR